MAKDLYFTIDPYQNRKEAKRKAIGAPTSNKSKKKN